MHENVPQAARLDLRWKRSPALPPSPAASRDTTTGATSTMMLPLVRFRGPCVPPHSHPKKQAIASTCATSS